jgi:hypothetical protein
LSEDAEKFRFSAESSWTLGWVRLILAETGLEPIGLEALLDSSWPLAANPGCNRVALHGLGNRCRFVHR